MFTNSMVALGPHDARVRKTIAGIWQKLEDALAAAYASLRPGGWLGFTLEAMAGEADGMEITPSGRYRHGRRYVERVLAASGFADVRVQGDTLRREAGQPVAGWVVRARRPADGTVAA